MPPTPEPPPPTNLVFICSDEHGAKFNHTPAPHEFAVP